MDYRTLGRTGVKVSPFCLGSASLGAWGNSDHDEVIRLIHRALDSGINFVDTADIYSGGEAETIIGKALADRRDDVFLATKFHAPMGDGPNQSGNSRRWVMQEVDSSLRRLGTDWIDLYQVHFSDPTTDIDETLGALTDLVRAGKVRYIGSSNTGAHQIVEAEWTAEKRARERFVCHQPPYSILVRGIENTVLPTCEKYGLGVISYSPLTGGWLSGKYVKGKELPVSSRVGFLPDQYDISSPGNQAKLEAADALGALARESGLPLPHLAIAFVLSHRAISSVIVGPRTKEQFDELIGAADVKLYAAVLDRIDEIVPPGTTLNPVDGGYQSPALSDSSLRRRVA
jgi:aryl-alcohol dehydrogenase-like predicted oxidoreductase